jgi:hypothetical protein
MFMFKKKLPSGVRLCHSRLRSAFSLNSFVFGVLFFRPSARLLTTDREKCLKKNVNKSRQPPFPSAKARVVLH